MKQKRDIKLTINTSTLTRIIRNLGFKNYACFRNFVVEKVTENKKYLLMHEEISKTDNSLKNFFISSNITIEQTFNSIEEKNLNQWLVWIGYNRLDHNYIDFQK